MNEANRPCPFCRSLISTEATKCRYCQSSLFSPGPTSADKIAELVVKSVGVVPILMALLLGVATIIGFKAMDDVQNSARRAESHASAIERDRHTISKLVVAEIDRHVDVLLNELTIDSSAPRAAEIREELKELLTALDREEESAIVQKSGKGPLLKALFAYYKGEYDDALKLVDQSRDDGRKYGIKGIILSHKADEAEQVKNAAAADEFRRQALQAFEYADRLAKREKRT